MNKNQTADRAENISILAEDVSSYGHFCEVLTERARELGSIALTECIKELVAKEFGLITGTPIQLQLRLSELSKVCSFINACRLPKSIINKFQPTYGV